MSESNQFQDIKDFELLESLLAEEGEPQAGPLAGELEVIRLLSADAANEVPLPQGRDLSAAVMGQITRRKKPPVWRGVALAVAAALVIGLVAVFLPKAPQSDGPIADASSQIMVDPALLAVAEHEQTRDAMARYLDRAERLLTAIRDYEAVCDANKADLSLEKKLANRLLVEQKQFSDEMDKPQYMQARQLFAQLETILVDLNTLNPCLDVDEIEFLNDHISRKRILSKVRLVAQDIRLS